MARQHFNSWISPEATHAGSEQVSSHLILQVCFLLPSSQWNPFRFITFFFKKSQISASNSNKIWCEKRFPDFHTQGTSSLLYPIMSMSSVNQGISNFVWKITLFKLNPSSIVALLRERKITFLRLIISKTSLKWYLSLKKSDIYRQKERILWFFIGRVYHGETNSNSW